MSAVCVITCLFDGNKTSKIGYGANIYDASWVDKLYRAVVRNTSHDIDFVCLVDAEYEFAEPVRAVMFNDRYGGWSAITEKYRPDLTDKPRFTCGLDTVIMGNIDDILGYDGYFGVLQDPKWQHTINNGVTMASDAFIQDYQHMWDTQRAEIMADELNYTLKPNARNNQNYWRFKRPAASMYHPGIKNPETGEDDDIFSEMLLLRNKYTDTADRLNVLYPNKIFSYNVEIRDNHVGWQKNMESASIIYFAKNPKQHDLLKEFHERAPGAYKDRCAFVKEHWI